VNGRVPGPGAPPGTGADLSGDAHGRFLRPFDFFRAVACVCVVAQHAVLWPVPPSSKVGWALVMLLHFTRNAFFFLAAFVACYAQLTRPRAVGALWWRRLTQVLVPFLFWTAAYFVFTMATSPAPPGRAVAELWHDAWFGYYQLYFVVVLVQLYVLLPLLVPLVVRARRAAVWILAASALLQLGMVSVSHYASWRTGVPGTIRTIDETLLTSRVLVGYQLYVVAGLFAALFAGTLGRFVARHWRGIAAASGATLLGALGYYLYGLAIGQTPGHASDLYQPVATVWFVGAIAGLCALGWRWAQSADRRPDGVGARVLTWGSDISGGLFFAHVLVLQLLLIGLNHTALRADGGWGSVAGVLFVGTVAITAAFVTVARRTPLRLVLTGPDRIAQRSSLRWWPARRVVPSRPPAVLEAAAAR
jgi:peptidoglycan/LPS O-acetylase OafA/YrhL